MQDSKWSFRNVLTFFRILFWLNNDNIDETENFTEEKSEKYI